MFKNCTLCPRMCGVDRTKGKVGYCRANDKLILARAGLHMWEEPCISGSSGSGTVFFSGCQLGCVYCQNKKIADMSVGGKVSLSRLIDIYFELEDKGANNINLVTASHYLPYVIKSIEMAKSRGIKIPFVYNTGGYERVESLKMLDGLIDIYLPDFKYMSPSISKRYSNASDYSKVCRDAIGEMYRQRGANKFKLNSLNESVMTSGVIVRHLVLPGLLGDSKRILNYLNNTYGDRIYISIMNQYTPIKEIIDKEKYPELLKRVTLDEYNEVIDYARKINIKCAYIQAEGADTDSFIPDFNLSGI